MTKITVNEAIAERIRSTAEDVEFVDKDGNLIGRLIRRTQAPISREQAEEHHTPLAELIIVQRNRE